jgi:hypothetical protein
MVIPRRSVCLLFSLFAAASISAREIGGSEAAAIAIAVDAFKQIYAKPDLRHYAVEVTRHGDELEITFLGDRPKRSLQRNETVPIEPSKYGPDMTYVVSLKRLKILRYNFYRD